MKIFISWSGTLSHQIACIFRDWLPSVIQSVRPYVSSEDIDKGTRWSSDIASELDSSNYGIIVVTKNNLNAPWIIFESGALSKSIDKANVSPFLFGVKRSEVQGPLLQFQSTIFEKDDVRKLVQSINNRLDEGKRLEAVQLTKTFEVWWNELDTKLKSVKDEVLESKIDDNRKDNQSEILEEILELVRIQQKILNSPESILPERYLENVLSLLLGSNIILSSNVSSKVNSLYKTVTELKQNTIDLVNQQDNEDALKPCKEKIYSVTKRLFYEIEEWNSELKDLEKQRFAKMRMRRIIPEF